MTTERTYGTCKACGQTMAPGVGCDELVWLLADGRSWPRTPYLLLRPDDALDPCPDCNAPTGGYHHAGCETDRCLHGQAIACRWDCKLAALAARHRLESDLADLRAATCRAGHAVDLAHGLISPHLPGLGRAGRESGTTLAPAGSRPAHPEVTHG